MLAQVVEQTENGKDEQDSEGLNTVAGYLTKLATFTNDSNLIINTTVSDNSGKHSLCR